MLQQGSSAAYLMIQYDSDIEKILTTLDCGSRKPDTHRFLTSLVNWSVEPMGCREIPVAAHWDARATWNRLTVELQLLLRIWFGQAGPVGGWGYLGILVVLTKKRDRRCGPIFVSNRSMTI